MVSLRFNITLHIRDSNLIFAIQNFFSSYCHQAFDTKRKVGTVVISTKTNTIRYNVNSLEDLNIIIEHFYRYPLITNKKNNFLIFVTIFNFLKLKKHLNREGLLLVTSFVHNLNNPIKEEKLNSILFSENLPSFISVPILINDNNNKKINKF